ncbi:MAG: hypothetical protein ACXVPN_14735 [Bacteroidia bacterium]
MGKKIAFIALVLAAVICGTWGYLYLEKLKKPLLTPLNVLPDNCFALVEIKEPKNFTAQLTQGNLMWEEFLKIGGIRKFNNAVLFLDSLTDEEGVKDYLGNEPLYIGYYGDEKKHDAVYGFNLGDINETQNATGFFVKKFSGKKTEGNTYECILSVEGSKTVFYVNIESGLVLASANKELLDGIASKTNKQILSANPKFTAAYNTTGKDKGLSLYFHFPYFFIQAWPQYLQNAMGGEYFTSQNERWIPADVELDPAEIGVKGFLPADSTVLYTVIKNQDPDNFKNLFASLPYYTSHLQAVNISDYGNFVRDNYNGNTEARRSDLKTYSDSLASDAQAEIAKFTGTYAASFSAGYNDTNYRYAVFNVSDNENALKFLRSVCDSVCVFSDSANLFYFEDKTLFKNLAAGFLKDGFKFASVLNENILFANSEKGISEYKKNISGRNNFSVNERAMAFIKDNFNAELNYLFYADVSKAKEMLSSGLSASLNASLDEAPELYEKFDAVGFSLQKTKENIFYNVQAGFNPKYKMYQNTLWETLADTDLAGEPAPVINHKTGEAELVCQDINNTLYLLSNTGKILWKKNVQEKILGDILQIDYLANGKLQLLFATENNIHAIDRNGNYLAGFPVKIKSGAAGGISLFDYDNNKNYRIWLPLKNNTVCCLTTLCKMVDGFVPVNIKAPLNRPIKQISIQQKDYFILTDTAGNVYVTNRKGEERFKIETKLPAGNYPLYFDIGKDLSKTYLCYADVRSKMFCRLSLEGKLEMIELKTEYKPAAFFFDTLKKEAPAQIVLASENYFEAFDFFGKKMTSVKISKDMQPVANCFNFSEKVIYASLEKESDLLIMASPIQKLSNEDEVKLSALPAAYNLIAGRPDYLVGFYQNKIFCFKP